MGAYISIERQIEDQFEGFDEDTLFVLTDGTHWLQDEYKYWYHYAYRPKVELLKKGARTYLRIVGREEMVAVRQISGVIESRIDGEFTGWSGESEYKLVNGQTWKQSEYKYEYTYAYSPSALVYETSQGMKMFVEGTSANVRQIT